MKLDIKLKRLILTLLLIFSTSAIAENTGEKQAKAFQSLYLTLCFKNINELNILRNKMEQLPQLPKEKAQPFLNGEKGKAYPIPNENGLFVLSLIDTMNMCAIYARRADTDIVKKDFINFFSNPPKPFLLKKHPVKIDQTKANGTTENLSYVWCIPNAPKVLFMLTVAPKEDATIQALFTVSKSSDTKPVK